MWSKMTMEYIITAIAAVEEALFTFLEISFLPCLLSLPHKNLNPFCFPFTVVLFKFIPSFSWSFLIIPRNCLLSFWIWFLSMDSHQIRRIRILITHWCRYDVNGRWLFFPRWNPRRCQDHLSIGISTKFFIDSIKIFEFFAGCYLDIHSIFFMQLLLVIEDH